MKTEELKKILKPLIKECIKEVLLEEDGVLSHVIKEVVTASPEKQIITEEKQKPVAKDQKAVIQRKLDEQKKHKKMLLDAIGIGSIDGVNVFSGTQPLSESQVADASVPSPLQGIDPNDPGVDENAIANLMGGMRKFKV